MAQSFLWRGLFSEKLSLNGKTNLCMQSRAVGPESPRGIAKAATENLFPAADFPPQTKGDGINFKRNGFKLSITISPVLGVRVRLITLSWKLLTEGTLYRLNWTYAYQQNTTKAQVQSNPNLQSFFTGGLSTRRRKIPDFGHRSHTWRTQFRFDWTNQKKKKERIG